MSVSELEWTEFELPVSELPEFRWTELEPPVFKWTWIGWTELCAALRSTLPRPGPQRRSVPLTQEVIEPAGCDPGACGREDPGEVEGNIG